MTTRNTKDEWLSVIEQAQRGIPSQFTDYKAPRLGTPEFAKCIDHTLLKLDAKGLQIDELCKEAKEHGFKVSDLPSVIELVELGSCSCKVLQLINTSFPKTLIILMVKLISSDSGCLRTSEIRQTCH